MPRTNIIWGEMESPIGVLFLAATSKGLCALSFYPNGQREMVDQLRWRLTKWLFGSVQYEKNQHAMELYMEQVDQYFQKKRKKFDLPVDLYGTPFQQAVWQQLCTIPYGQCISYKALAEQIGRPRAARAVGRANNQNPVAIVCPCHRVIGADGSLVGYGGGLERKRFLLRHEGYKFKK